MNWIPQSFRCLAAIISPGLFFAAAVSFTVPENASAQLSPAIDFYEPAVLTGTIYVKAAGPKVVLFTFKRTATRSGQTVQVVREFTAPDGKLAARERVQYEGDGLVSFELEEPGSGAAGTIAVDAEGTSGSERKVHFTYSAGTDSSKKTDSEKFQRDTLVSDMIAPWLAAHWVALTNGSAVKFRYAVPARLETVGFKFVKESEGTWHGIPVMTVKMEPTSWVIARLVDPLHFTMEKEGQHRVLQYIGRTTPRLQQGKKWEDLDAVSVYDWK